MREMTRTTDTPGGTATTLFSRLFKSSRQVRPAGKRTKPEAYAATSGAVATEGAQANTVRPFFNASVRKDRFQQQEHPQNCVAPVEKFGYSSAEEFNSRFERGGEIAKGGNGVIRLVVERKSGQKFACKTLPKKLHAAGTHRQEADVSMPECDRNAAPSTVKVIFHKIRIRLLTSDVPLCKFLPCQRSVRRQRRARSV